MFSLKKLNKFINFFKADSFEGKVFLGLIVFLILLYICLLFSFTSYTLIDKDFVSSKSFFQDGYKLNDDKVIFEKDFSKYSNMSDANFYYVQRNGILDTNKPVVYSFIAPLEYAFEIELKTSYADKNVRFEACINKILVEKEDLCSVSEKLTNYTKENCLSNFYPEAILSCENSLELQNWQTSKIIFNYMDQFNHFYLIITPDGIVELNRVINGEMQFNLLFVQTDLNNQEWNNIKVIKLKDEISIFVNDEYIETFYDFKEGFFDYKKDFFGGQSGIIAIESKECRTQIRRLIISGIDG